MNVTFMIGNGFDLKMGLKSKYTDIYNVYTDVNNKTDDTIIENFKEVLRKDSPKYENWSDFEKAMGQHAKDFENEIDYVKCVRDFRDIMADCLTQEQSAFFVNYFNSNEISDKLYRIFTDSIYNFYSDETPNIINEIKYMEFRQGSFDFNFLNFNYTFVLERFIKLFRNKSQMINAIKNHIHIHGSLDDNIVLGVDNLEQLKNEFEITSSIKRTFVKPYFNEETDKQKIELAKDIISKSDIICVYGMALGDTDLMWKNLLVEWLHNSSHHLMFYFSYPPTDIPLQKRDEILDKEEELKKDLMQKLKIDSKQDLSTIINQIHIPVTKDLFDISTIDISSSVKSDKELKN